MHAEMHKVVFKWVKCTCICMQTSIQPSV